MSEQQVRIVDQRQLRIPKFFQSAEELVTLAAIQLERQNQEVRRNGQWLSEFHWQMCLVRASGQPRIDGKEMVFIYVKHPSTGTELRGEGTTLPNLQAPTIGSVWRVAIPRKSLPYLDTPQPELLECTCVVPEKFELRTVQGSWFVLAGWRAPGPDVIVAPDFDEFDIRKHSFGGRLTEQVNGDLADRMLGVVGSLHEKGNDDDIPLKYIVTWPKTSSPKRTWSYYAANSLRQVRRSGH
jgi:hypothetical protein